MDIIIRLFDKDSKEFNTLGIGVLKDALSCICTEELNGTFEIEMEYPVSGNYYDEIQTDRILYCKPNKTANEQAFRIYSIEKNTDGKIVVKAQHLSYDLGGIIYDPPVNSEGTLKKWTSLDDAIANIQNGNGIIMPDVYEGKIPFTFERSSDKLDVQKECSIKEPSNLREVLGGMDGSILDTYKGELEFDNFKVKIHSSRGSDKGVSIRYGSNMKSLTHTTTSEAKVTGIFPYYSSDVTNNKALGSKTYAKVYIVGPYEFAKKWIAYNIGSIAITPVVEKVPVQISVEDAESPNRIYDGRVICWQKGVTAYINTRCSEDMSKEWLTLAKESITGTGFNPTERLNEEFLITSEFSPYSGRIYKWDNTNNKYVEVESQQPDEGYTLTNAFIVDGQETFSAGWLMDLDMAKPIDPESTYLDIPITNNGITFKIKIIDYNKESNKDYDNRYFGWDAETQSWKEQKSIVNGQYYLCDTKDFINKGLWSVKVYCNTDSTVSTFSAKWLIDKVSGLPIQPIEGIVYRVDDNMSDDADSDYTGKFYTWDNANQCYISAKAPYTEPNIYNKATDTETTKESVKINTETDKFAVSTPLDAYIVGPVEFASNWLSRKNGGSELKPSDKLRYIIKSNANEYLYLVLKDDYDAHKDRYSLPRDPYMVDFRGNPAYAFVYDSYKGKYALYDPNHNKSKAIEDLEYMIAGYIDDAVEPFGQDWLRKFNTSAPIQPIPSYYGRVYEYDDNTTKFKEIDIVDLNIVDEYRYLDKNGWVTQSNESYQERKTPIPGEILPLSKDYVYYTLEGPEYNPVVTWSEETPEKPATVFSRYTKYYKLVTEEGVTYYKESVPEPSDYDADNKKFTRDGWYISNSHFNMYYSFFTSDYPIKNGIMYMSHEIKDQKYQKIMKLDMTDFFTDKPSVNALKDAAETYIKENKDKLISDDVETTTEIIDIKVYDDYDKVLNIDNTITLGDMVTIVYPQFNINEKKQVITTEYDVLLDRYTSIEVGKKTSDLSQTVIVSGDSISKLDNDSGYTDENRVSKMVADSITAATGEFIDLTTQNLNIAGNLNTQQAEIAQLIAGEMTAQNGIIKGTLMAGDIELKGIIHAVDGEFTGELRSGLIYNTVVDVESDETLNDSKSDEWLSVWTLDGWEFVYDGDLKDKAFRVSNQYNSLITRNSYYDNHKIYFKVTFTDEGSVYEYYRPVEGTDYNASTKRFTASAVNKHICSKNEYYNLYFIYDQLEHKFMQTDEWAFHVDKKGNVTISQGSIKLGKTTNGYNFALDNNGNVTIKSGSITIGGSSYDPNFNVDNDGNVTIKNGNITLSQGAIQLGQSYISKHPYNFEVDSDGYVTINNGHFRIGYVRTVEDRDIYNLEVDDQGVVRIENGDIHMYSGEISIGGTATDPVFYVNDQGEVSISSGEIKLGLIDPVTRDYNFTVNDRGEVNLKSGYININNKFIVDDTGDVVLTGNSSLKIESGFLQTNKNYGMQSNNILLSESDYNYNLIMVYVSPYMYEYKIPYTYGFSLARIQDPYAFVDRDVSYLTSVINCNYDSSKEPFTSDWLICDEHPELLRNSRYVYIFNKDVIYLKDSNNIQSGVNVFIYDFITEKYIPINIELNESVYYMMISSRKVLDNPAVITKPDGVNYTALFNKMFKYTSTSPSGATTETGEFNTTSDDRFGRLSYGVDNPQATPGAYYDYTILANTNSTWNETIKDSYVDVDVNIEFDITLSEDSEVDTEYLNEAYLYLLIVQDRSTIDYEIIRISNDTRQSGLELHKGETIHKSFSRSFGYNIDESYSYHYEVYFDTKYYARPNPMYPGTHIIDNKILEGTHEEPAVDGVNTFVFNRPIAPYISDNSTTIGTKYKPWEHSYITHYRKKVGIPVQIQNELSSWNDHGRYTKLIELSSTSGFDEYYIDSSNDRYTIVAYPLNVEYKVEFYSRNSGSITRTFKGDTIIDTSGYNSNYDASLYNDRSGAAYDDLLRRAGSSYPYEHYVKVTKPTGRAKIIIYVETTEYY